MLLLFLTAKCCLLLRAHRQGAYASCASSRFEFVDTAEQIVTECRSLPLSNPRPDALPRNKERLCCPASSAYFSTGLGLPCSSADRAQQLPRSVRQSIASLVMLAEE